MFNLIKIFEKINLEDKYIIFMRHAEKLQSRNIHAGAALGLTEEGINQTHILAEYFKQRMKKNKKIKTSPIKRCVQTAEILSACFDRDNSTIELSNILGGPGAYVNDDKRALSVFTKYNVYEVLEKQLKNDYLPGMRSLDEGTKLLLDTIKSDLMTNIYSTICISHDVILMAFIRSLLKNRQFDRECWINYLEGFCIQESLGKLFLHFDDASYEIVF